MKVFRRYTVVSVMILLCFFSAFLALYNGLMATAQAGDIIRAENNYAYTEELILSIYVKDGVTADELLELAGRIEKCNVYLESMLVYFNEIDSAYRPYILLKQNEPLSLPTSKKISRIPENGIIVPSWVESDELTVHGRSFRIIDRMDWERYPFISYTFTLNSADYLDAFPDALDGARDVSLRVASNLSDVGETYAQIQEAAAELMPGASVSGMKTDSKVSIFQSGLSMENLVSSCLFLFALINTVIISYYWVVVRKREIAIRKAFGANNFHIVKLMTAELLEIIGAASLLASVVQILMWIIQGREISLSGSAVLVAGLLFAMTLATFAAMIVPVRIILNIQPSEGVRL